MKKIQILFIFLFFLFAWIWEDYKKIDTKYINQSPITIDYKNLNNNILKNIHNFLNLKIENFMFTYLKNHQNYWKLEKDDREQLPEYKVIKSEGNFTASNNKIDLIEKNWFRSHGNNSSNRFSNLDYINEKNSKKLSIAWVFESKDSKADIQANPIAVNGVIYTPISGGYIAAIDGATGNLKWKSKAYGNFVAKRGLVYWPGDPEKKIEPRLIFSDREKLISIRADNGKQIKSFGKNGEVKTGLNVITPVIYKNLIIIATWKRAFEVYDLYSGKIHWKIKYLKPKKTLFTHMTALLDYEELLSKCSENIEPSYDGMTIEL